MGIRQYREAAHESMRPLWLACNEALASDSITVLSHPNGNRITRVSTELGARIVRLGDAVSVEHDYLRITEADGLVEGTYEITFPDDIRDLSESRVRDEWNSGVKSGARVVGVRDYPVIAREILRAFNG